MRTHTALHILCGVVWRDYKASVTGGNMEPLKGRMDFEFPSLSAELRDEIEEKINVEVREDRKISVDFSPDLNMNCPGRNVNFFKASTSTIHYKTSFIFSAATNI